MENELFNQYDVLFLLPICYICKNPFKNSERNYTLSDLGKSGIIIPQGMTSKDRVCHACYFTEDNKRVKVTQDPSIQIRGLEIHDKALTPEEIKEMFERGPPNIDDRQPHIISHKDEDEGYLWIDGKKVKKENKDELK